MEGQMMVGGRLHPSPLRGRGTRGMGELGFAAWPPGFGSKFDSDQTTDFACSPLMDGQGQKEVRGQERLF